MRRASTVTMLMLSCIFSLAAQLAERRVDFENDEVGKLPRFFTTAVTNDLKEGKWVVEEVEGAPSGKRVLAQRDAADDADRMALCLYESDKIADVDVEVRLNLIDGKTDQSAGVVARCIDRNNYYVACADAQAGNVRLYTVVQGKPTQIGAQPVAVDAKKWHKLRLVVTGRHFQVYFNDVMLFELDDDAHRDPGQIGVWTKADTVALFDDLVIRPIAKEEKK
jgi:hypothetical protein